MAIDYVDKQTVGILGTEYLVSDIHKLANNKKAHKVPLTRFEEDMVDASWFEEGVAPNMEEIAFHIERIQQANLKYPIVYLRDRGLLDGWHRIFKAKLNGDTSISVVFLDEHELETLEKQK